MGNKLSFFGNFFFLEREVFSREGSRGVLYVTLFHWLNIHEVGVCTKRSRECLRNECYKDLKIMRASKMINARFGHIKNTFNTCDLRYPVGQNNSIEFTPCKNSL